MPSATFHAGIKLTFLASNKPLVQTSDVQYKKCVWDAGATRNSSVVTSGTDSGSRPGALLSDLISCTLLLATAARGRVGDGHFLSVVARCSSWQNLKSYQDYHRFVTVRTHDNFAVLPQ